MVFNQDGVIYKLYLPLTQNQRNPTLSIRALNQYKDDTRIVAEDLSQNPLTVNLKINDQAYATTIEVVPQGDTIGLSPLYGDTPFSFGQKFIDGQNIFSSPFMGELYLGEVFKPILDAFSARLQRQIPKRNFGLDNQNVIPIFDHVKKTCKLIITDLAGQITQTYREFFSN